MLNDQGYGQPDFLGTPQQQQQQQTPNMGSLVTTPGEMFGYPMSAPATAPAFDSRFWDADPNMAGMDIEFYAAAAAEVFQTTPTQVHRPMGSLDWVRTNQIFQETGVLPPQNLENIQPPPTPSERPIAPKQVVPALDTMPTEQPVFTGGF